MHRKKQDLLAVEARHIGRTMDAFMTPGAMFNYGLENFVHGKSEEHELDATTTNE